MCQSRPNTDKSQLGSLLTVGAIPWHRCRSPQSCAAVSHVGWRSEERWEGELCREAN